MTLSHSLDKFCRPNSSFAFDFFQHHVHILHRRNYYKQKAVVVVTDTSMMLGLPIKWEMQDCKSTETSRMHLRGIGNWVFGHFRDGGRRSFLRKKCFWNTSMVKLQRMFKHFCCHPEGRCGFSSVGSLEELSVTVTMCGRKYGLWCFFLLA